MHHKSCEPCLGRIQELEPKRTSATEKQACEPDCQIRAMRPLAYALLISAFMWYVAIGFFAGWFDGWLS